MSALLQRTPLSPFVLLWVFFKNKEVLDFGFDPQTDFLIIPQFSSCKPYPNLKVISDKLRTTE